MIGPNFEQFQHPLPGLSGADRLRLFDALPESVQEAMWKDLAWTIADRRFLDGELPFQSRKPKRKRRPVRQPATPVADDWRRMTETLASIPAETYLPILDPDCEPSRGHVRCPLPDHEDRHPSATYKDSVWYCHRCGEGGGIFQLGSELSGLGDHGDEFCELRRWVAERMLGAAT